MNVLEIKGSLFDMLWAVDDEKILIKIQEFVSQSIQIHRKEDSDWWDELSSEQQRRLENAISDSEEGINLVPHEAVFHEMTERLNRMKNEG